MKVSGIKKNDLRSIDGFPIGYEELMRFGIDYCDAITLSSENINQRLLNYVETSKKPVLKYQNNDPQLYLDFCNSLLDGTLA